MTMDRRTFLAHTTALAATAAAASPASAAMPAAAQKSDPRRSGVNFDPRSAAPECTVSPKGVVTMNPNQTVGNVTCFGCTTQCGVRVRVDKTTGRVIRVAGNPYHPLATHRHLLMSVPVKESLLAMSQTADGGQLLRPAICGRGNAMLEKMTSPQRITTPLKRVGPRNGGRWMPISFEQLVREVVHGGDLFGEGHVNGLQALRDLKTPIDAAAPELGPRVNQVGVLMSTDDGRDAFSRRFWNQSYGTLNYVGHGSWCGGSYRSSSAAVFGDMKKMGHGKPDFESAEFILFMGTSPGQAGNPFKRTAEIVSERRAKGELSYVVVDPVMTNASNRASGPHAKWLPIRPSTDGALAMGMIRWMIETDRVNRDYLTCPNLGIAQKHGHPSFSAATWLVIADPAHPRFGAFVRPADLGLPDENPDVGVVLQADGYPTTSLAATAPAELDVDTTMTLKSGTVRVKSSFRLLKEESSRLTLAQYAEACGVPKDEIVELAKTFTSHGVKASAVSHGGMMSGSGFYNAFAIVTLNVLIGNLNCKGGFVMNGSGYKYAGDGPRYDLAHFEGQVKPRGIPLGRNVPYGKTTEFKAKKAGGTPFPARDAWFPNAPGLGTEWFNSLVTHYPYGLKALILWMCNPVYGMPGVRPAVEAVLADPKKLPLIVAIDCFVNESNAYADYIVPDTHMYETWGWIAPWNGVPTKTMAARWPVATPVTAPDATGRPVSMETFLMALAAEMKLPGFGKGALKDRKGRLLDLLTPEDWYMRGGANVAFAGKPVGDATDEDMRLTGVERLRSDLQRTLQPDEWRKAASLYCRGGRFEAHDAAADPAQPEWMAHRFEKPLYLWNEKVATAPNALSGKKASGCAAWREPAFADGSAMREHYPAADWPLLAVSYKSVLQSSYSTDTSLSMLHGENPVFLHPDDARALGVSTGDAVELATPAAAVSATVKVDAGVARRVVAVEHGFGHRGLGARDIVVGEKTIPAHPRAGLGVNINDLGILDPTRPGLAMWVDATSGACVRNGLPARIRKTEA